jgi:hypothetical protein
VVFERDLISSIVLTGCGGIGSSILAKNQNAVCHSFPPSE